MRLTPIAKKINYTYEIHGQTIVDNYSWIRDPKWPEVEDTKILNYLEEENQYFEQFFAPLSEEKTKIFDELKARIKLLDVSVPIKKDDYYYYTRTEETKDYPIYCRAKHSIANPADIPELLPYEEILLNVNDLAKDKKFTKIGSFAISPNHKLLAYSVDFAGDERYTAKIYNLETKEYFADTIDNTIGSLVWQEDLSGFFYNLADENWRHNKVMFHKLGTGYKEDRLILHESDPLYNVSVSKTSSRKYILIEVGGAATNEIYVIDIEDKTFTPHLLKPKKDTFYYSVEHNGDYFYIHTNYGAKNYHIVRIKTDNLAQAKWETHIEENEDAYLSSFDITQNYLILNYKENANPVIKIQNLTDHKTQTINFPDPVFVAASYSTNFNEDDIRVNYTSFTRPDTTYAYEYANDKLTILKIREVPSGFNSEEYKVERVWAENDGIKVPLSIFYKKSLFKHDGSNSLYLFGYGSYGISIYPAFNNTAVSLVNRGFVYVIAHIRGGDELGQDWHESAKFLNKQNTFQDFIQSAKYLIDNKYTSSGNIVAVGGSAGGMLIGAAINEAPELFKAVIAHVPFVDVLNTMLDETLPLTPGEYKEWGNPKELEYFNYIKSYSPYDNIKAQNYPTVMVTAGLSDPRVGYWEAAKWVARLREMKTDDNLIIFKTNLDAGHMGASGRFDYLKEVAEDLAFIFKIFGNN